MRKSEWKRERERELFMACRVWKEKREFIFILTRLFGSNPSRTPPTSPPPHSVELITVWLSGGLDCYSNHKKQTVRGRLACHVPLHLNYYSWTIKQHFGTAYVLPSVFCCSKYFFVRLESDFKIQPAQCWKDDLCLICRIQLHILVIYYIVSTLWW